MATKVENTIRGLMADDLGGYIDNMASRVREEIVAHYGDADEFEELIAVAVRYALVGDRTPDSNYDPVTGFGFTNDRTQYALRLIVNFLRHDQFNCTPPDSCARWLHNLEHLSYMEPTG